MINCEYGGGLGRDGYGNIFRDTRTEEAFRIREPDEAAKLRARLSTSSGAINILIAMVVA